MMQRGRARAALVLGAAAVSLMVAVGSSGSASTLTVKTNATLGKLLASAAGRTLYHSPAEKANTVKCTGTCAVAWPPLLIAAGAKPVGGPGTTASLLGTVKRPDGKLQVTYKGFPLYTYSGDRTASDVKGQGLDGWHALAPSGAVVTKSVSSTATNTSSTTGTGKGSTGSTGSTGSSSTSSGSSTGSVVGTGTSADCNKTPEAPGCM